MTKHDVTIRGAGVFGLTTAFVCLQRGARVRVIDPGGPGAGASGGIVGALAPHTPNDWNPKKAFQFRCLVEAEARWQEVSQVSGEPTGYGRTGRLQPLASDRAVALARTREADAATNWPGFQWEVRGATVFDTLTARIHPRQACDALAGAVAAFGGEIVQAGSEEGAVVHATGWDGLRELSGTFGREIGNGVKGQAILLRGGREPDAPQVFADGVHIVPHADGTVAIGSTSERDFDHPTQTDAAADALLEQAIAILPELHGQEIAQRWAGVRPRAITRAPLVGAWPERPGHFIANGGFKIGFGIAWGVADLMAGLLEGRDGVPEPFRVEAALTV